MFFKIKPINLIKILVFDCFLCYIVKIHINKLILRFTGLYGITFYAWTLTFFSGI